MTDFPVEPCRASSDLIEDGWMRVFNIICPLVPKTYRNCHSKWGEVDVWHRIKQLSNTSPVSDNQGVSPQCCVGSDVCNVFDCAKVMLNSYIPPSILKPKCINVGDGVKPWTLRLTAISATIKVTSAPSFPPPPDLMCWYIKFSSNWLSSS